MINRAAKEADEKMKKALENTEHELATIRAGRASLALLDGIIVNAYGTDSPLKQVASLNTPEPLMITIQPWDKGLIPAIEKSIMKSNIGITPSNDGKIIRLNIPQLTEERRKELVKIVKHLGEEGKIAMRNVRRLINEQEKKLEKSHEISEDDMLANIDEVQKVTDKYILLIDEVLKKKEAEIMEV